MKAKKILSALLTGALVFGTVSFTALADEASKTLAIGTLEELKAFAAEVNAGTNSYKGWTVTLTDNIDLNNEEWTPIGKSEKTFQGIFDGNGKTVSNLKTGGKSQSDVGFFGVTTDGEIKNLTIENAKVTGYLDVGVVAGTPYTSKYTDITVKGNIEVNGFAYVGGAFGKNAYANITNVDILAKEGSYVKAYSGIYRTYVGGLVGFMGEGNITVSDCDVKIDVTGSTCDIGGLLGILHYGNKLENCTYGGSIALDNELSNLDSGDETEFGALVGVSHDQNGTTTKILDCTATVISAVRCGEDITDSIGAYGNFYSRNELGENGNNVLYEATVNSVKTVESAGNISQKEINDCIGNGNYLDGNVVKSAADAKNNENLTDKEKKDIVEKIVISNDSSAAVDIIKDLPTEEKESIALDTVKKVADNAGHNKVTGSLEGKIEATAVKTDTQPIQKILITENADTNTLKQADSIDALYVAIDLHDEDNNKIAETEVPVYIEVTVGDNTKVQKVLRKHDGVIENVPFEREEDGTTISLSSAKFSDYAIVMTQNLTSGSAVLGFKAAAATEENTAVFNLYLSADDAATVEKFESGEFKFIKTGTSEAEFTAAEGLTIEYDEATDLYKVYHTNGEAPYRTVEDVDGKKAILLGTVTLTGIGQGSVSVSDIKMYRHSQDGNNLAIDIDTTATATTPYEIKAATKKLTVNVTFPNNIVNQKTLYQDMTVAIKGGEVDETYKLGSDASNVVAWDETNNAYTLTISDKLVANTAYTVTVSGAGYRTARYTVTMTADKTLNFWNNVKDTPAVVEEGSSTGAKSVTFLAGDIVKDGKINIYDLSAVVSYFGTNNTVNAESAYAKYDLNRDGKIDSKDVAYVLVSWGK